MRKLRIILSLIILLVACVNAIAAEKATVEKTIIDFNTINQKPVVQMAILLDTSGSMSGLIDQARGELWAIVNEFIYARKDGIAPEVQVALFEYGKSTVPSEDGFVRLIVPFTTDLDKISEELFALTTNGGDEYCGWVIKDAVEKLKWSERAEDLKVIFIAGNEPFTQGKVDYKESCKAAIEKGIVVNTIHCGSESEGINGKWKDGAVLADGRFLNIDHNRAIVHIAAPQDEQITAMNLRLNKTYIAYGENGLELSERQQEQDKNAAVLSAEASVQRVVAKSSANYVNAGWDLVDAVNNNKIKIEELKDKELPENMRTMSKAQRKEYVEQQSKKRTEIQEQIQKLNAERKKYVTAEMEKLQQEGNTLGSAVIETIREQAKSKDFEFEKPEEKSETDAEKNEAK